MAEPTDPTPEEDQIGGIAGNAVGDHPTKYDSLGFRPYVEAIAAFLLADATKPPITISIEGEWGSGKSSFLLQLENAITGEQPREAALRALPRWLGGEGAGGSLSAAWEKLRAPRPPLTVRFNAWRHDKQDSLWAAFALAFVQSLRKEIGFRRAWTGDLWLFLSRLKTFKGWALLVLFLLSALLLILGVTALVVYLLRLAPADLYTLLQHILRPAPKESDDTGLVTSLTSLATHGAWGAIAAIGIAGVAKFHDHFKLPLSLSLEKYLAKPDYAGHVAFIEDFHVDLARLIDAYAGRSRVFIFVDDLDRCDVPRAAELMQAINLMIGDSGNLVFILGMDREKVAAGVAYKYKDLIPLLRESAQWKPGVGKDGKPDKDDFTSLYFGYSYLEKFIQLSFSLPIANNDASLNAFLSDRPVALPIAWRTRLWAYWSARLKPPQLATASTLAGASPSAGALVGVTTPIPQPAAPSPPKVDYRRIHVEEDTDRTRKVVRMVSSLFENNPRRIKQFTNTFRLALYIGSDQGMFDRLSAEKVDEVSPEQIGKFVALLLRFPDLRYKLEDDSNLLASLEKMAVEKVAHNVDFDPSAHWLNMRGTVELLTHGIDLSSMSGLYPSMSTPAHDRYSLANLNVTRLFSVLPRAQRPPAPAPSTTAPAESATAPQTSQEADERILTELLELATKYETIRGSKPSSGQRTAELTRVVEEAIEAAKPLQSSSGALGELSTTDAGDRMMSLAVAYTHVDPSNAELLLEMFDDFLSPFEHYWCIVTLSNYVNTLTAAQNARIIDSLNRNWTAISKDQGRVKAAENLREKAELALEALDATARFEEAKTRDARRKTPAKEKAPSAPNPVSEAAPEIVSEAPLPSSVPDQRDSPLDERMRVAYQNLYSALEKAMEATVELAILDLLRQAAEETSKVLNLDGQLRLQSSPDLSGTLMQQMYATENRLKSLQPELSRANSKVVSYSELISAIDQVLSLNVAL